MNTHTNELAATKLTSTIIIVTPEMATRWLALNTRNRKIRQVVVARYKNEMANGRWTFAGDPIRFDTNGNLLDGQHRLTALSETPEATIPMLVVRGLPTEAQAVMDQGARRTPGDQLGLRGLREPNQVAAGVKVYLIWQEGYLFRDNKAATSAITSPWIEEWTMGNLPLVNSITDFMALIKSNDAPPSVAYAAALKFHQIDATQAKEFFTLLARGAGTHGHPIVALDKRLQTIRRSNLKLSNRDFLALFIQAWNHWRSGSEISKLTRPRGGLWTESNFPHPR